MKHDLVWCLRGVCGVPLTPVVADGVRKNISVSVERSARDGSAHRRVSLQTVLGVLVPEVEGAVATRRAERTVDRVEGDGVDGVDVADIAVVRWRLTVALETEVRAGVLVLDVLNGAATFDTAHGKARRVGEAADYPRLPLQGGLHSLVELGGVVEVDDVDVSVSCTDDQELVLDVHRVDTLLAFHSGDRSRLSEIPILDSLVP